MGQAEIGQIELLACRAWPAEEVTELDGWLLRYARGVTRRANSVWPNAYRAERALAARVDEVEAFYANRGLPPRFQICPAARPAALDEQLAARGYDAVAPTHVQLSALETLLARTAPDTVSDTVPDSAKLIVDETCSDAWFDAYQQAEAVSATEGPVRRAIIERIATPTGFALLTEGRAPIALGLGVLDAGHLGIFSMATLPAYRRRGAATRVLYALARWAHARGGHRAYLQVMQNNEPARALYARAGFATLYDYHYREQRPAQPAAAG